VDPQRGTIAHELADQVLHLGYDTAGALGAPVLGLQLLAEELERRPVRRATSDAERQTARVG
jgi:hypothetical protein